MVVRGFASAPSHLMTVILLLVFAASAMARAADGMAVARMEEHAHRFLSSEDGDDDGDDEGDDAFWAFDDRSTVWTEYSILPRTCQYYQKKPVIVYDIFGDGNDQCQKKKQGSYFMDIGTFVFAYSKQIEDDYELQGNDYDEPEALEYIECTAFDYNDSSYYVQLGCSSTGVIRIITFTDQYCTNEVNISVGLSNDIKINFSRCKSCVTWPSKNNNDDDGDDGLDDNYDYYHQYDSKLCSAASYYKTKCNRKCQRLTQSYESDSSETSGWTGIEKFFLFFWFMMLFALIWVVLKQRRMMSRESALVEEGSMNGVGLKKRHIFPIALAIFFFILLFMFLIQKKLTWLMLISSNVGLFVHLVVLRRKARQEERATGYHADGGLQIS